MGGSTSTPTITSNNRTLKRLHELYPQVFCKGDAYYDPDKKACVSLSNPKLLHKGPLLMLGAGGRHCVGAMNAKGQVIAPHKPVAVSEVVRMFVIVKPKPPIKPADAAELLVPTRQSIQEQKERDRERQSQARSFSKPSDETKQIITETPEQEEEVQEESNIPIAPAFYTTTSPNIPDAPPLLPVSRRSVPTVILKKPLLPENTTNVSRDEFLEQIRQGGKNLRPKPVGTANTSKSNTNNNNNNDIVQRLAKRRIQVAGSVEEERENESTLEDWETP